MFQALGSFETLGSKLSLGTSEKVADVRTHLRKVLNLQFEIESGTKIGNSLEFDFVVPLNHCVLLDNPKTIERLGLLS